MTSLVGKIALLAACALPAPAQTQAVVVPMDAARFVPIDPKLPNGPAIAVLRGNPATGPSDMLLRMRRANGQLHVHSSDYRLSIVQGRMKHWSRGESEVSAPILGPGSYWFQPGGQAHGDSCLDDICIMFISWSGKRDAKLAL